MDAWTPDELKQELDKGSRIFLKLWKKGCGVCKLANPASDKLERDDEFKMKFGRIAVDEYPEMLQIAGTEVLPVFFVFDQKKKKGMYTGFKGYDKLYEFVSDSLKA